METDQVTKIPEIDQELHQQNNPVGATYITQNGDCEKKSAKR